MLIEKDNLKKIDSFIYNYQRNTKYYIHFYVIKALKRPNMQLKRMCYEFLT